MTDMNLQPPLVKGGQGRTAKSLTVDATTLTFLGIALIAGGVLVWVINATSGI